MTNRKSAAHLAVVCRRVLAEVEEKKEELRAKATEQARLRTGGFVRRA